MVTKSMGDGRNGGDDCLVGIVIRHYLLMHVFWL